MAYADDMETKLSGCGRETEARVPGGVQGATLLTVAFAAVAALSGAGPVTGQQPVAGVDVAEAIQTRIESDRASGLWFASGHELRANEVLSLFYEDRGFAPVWTTGQAERSRMRELLEGVLEAERHGLRPSDYHLSALDSLSALATAGRADLDDLVDLELLASDAFMTLASHLLMGRVDPETIDPEWIANRREAKFEDVLAAAVASEGIAATLAAQAPPQPRYARLVTAAEELRALAAAGGWPALGEGESLKEGASGPRVRRLRARLAATGELSTSGDSDILDTEATEAVKRFQTRHGLDVDGVVGPATRAALDVSAEARAQQIRVNLERWRWLPEDLGRRRIEVNIAGFDVRVVEDGRTVRRHRAVVGHDYRQTPSFSRTMTYLVLAPYWHVPPGIAARDKLPDFQAHPGAVVAQGFTVFAQGTNEAVDPTTIDWASLTGAELNRRYRLRQDPGPQNSLGRVKFMFPNRHAVYLHDTPARQLFDRATRTFSSGCIRVEDPMGLAEYLLADQPGWTRSEIERVADDGVDRTVRLTDPLPVHLLYWTAWATEDGIVHFREDVYGRDDAVLRGIDEAPVP